MAFISCTGTISWFFMPISTATNVRNVSFSMYRRMFTSNFIVKVVCVKRGGGSSRVKD
ncbi:unknown protein [Bathycoccus prasinos]|uniref:Uncharacterized protein n=1 Tax=Bathycoccus prasinos TaxID=41875 RepID=K8F521_9CHLO|nr:unknown protein [Bathycoccus prasinos]CCO16653.1 unknown protein [Bathycoccus prasinos]|eukprot:XP_007513095.1 unknown protein [Bathycoccus prasinos]